jgi:glycosyltransferase involved in cell wall biosynthesis
LYLAGPGDAADVLRHMATGDRYDHVAHVAYSGQLFEACRDLDAALLCVSANRRADDFAHGELRALNVPDLMPPSSGAAYHFANLRFARRVARYAREHQANVIITATEPYPFLLEPLARRGIAIVPALHATLLPEFKRAGLVRRLSVRMSRHFFKRTCPAVLTHPGACARQAHEVAAGQPRPLVEFLPLYRGNVFAGVAPPVRGDTFNVITVGRVEPEKGVFDLVEVAKRLRDAGRTDIRFDICGTGSALEPARDLAKRYALDGILTLHGWTAMDKLLELWGRSHAAVVPTTRDFVEGFNQVVIEAILAGRPVITSQICPALDFVRGSALEVPPDDVDAYRQGILRLADDPTLYSQLQGRCADVSRPFLDPSKSFGRAVRHILASLAAGREVEPIYHPPARA